jgi:hypothetical protein
MSSSGMMPLTTPLAYQTSAASPDWLNKGDNAWQLTAATLVGLQSFPGLVVLYGGEVGRELGLHGAVRVRGGVDLLGDVGLQHVVRRQAAAAVGARPGPR